MKYTYLLINLFSVIVPFIFSFHPRIKFYKKFKFLFPGILITGIVFIIWDIIFTEKGVWGFNPDYLLGIYLINLPLEEVLFFICIPYASIFIYESLIVLGVKDYFVKTERRITQTLIGLCAFIAFMNYDKLYTVTAFGFCALFLLFSSYKRLPWMSRFYFSYLFVLIPFFIVNGILTGTGLNEPVVWYNNDENLGVRMFTIPLEDTFYGMLMLLSSVAIYEKGLGRFP